MYTWLTCDKTTGAIGTHQQTQTPMLQIITTTVGSGTPTTITIGATTLEASTSTTTSMNEQGETETTTVIIKFDPNLISANQNIIGIFDDLTVIMNAEEQAVFDTPQAYLYQNGVFVANPNYPEIQLQNAKTAKITTLNTAYNSALNTKFSTTALGASVEFNYDSDSQLKFSKLITAYNAGVITYPRNITDSSGKIQSFTDATQIKQLLTDMYAFETGLEDKLQTLVQQVLTAKTVDAVNAINWS